MPTLNIDRDLEMYYETDCFVEPWEKPESLMLLHGCAESGIVWYDWMPLVARRFNVVRPDMRGFGRSTPTHTTPPGTPPLSSKAITVASRMSPRVSS